MDGIGVHRLSGGSEYSSDELLGQKVHRAELKDNRLELELDKGTFEIFDNGQTGFENRFMVIDDDLSTIVGGRILSIEMKPGATISTEDDEHEQVFVEIATDKGLITIANHNEHSGYYGGFALTINEIIHGGR